MEQIGWLLLIVIAALIFWVLAMRAFEALLDSLEG